MGIISLCCTHFFIPSFNFDNTLSFFIYVFLTLSNILSHVLSGGLFGPSQGGVHFDTESSFSEPIEHLNLLASQTLAAVRDLVLKRHRTGNKTIAEIYRHFDRKGKRFFNALDFMQATADLRIETTERVATLAVAQMALDSPRDRVSLGKFPS